MILLTGATGYIGSHIWVELLNKSIPVIGVDNLSNSKIECLDAISQVSGQTLKFFHGDIRDSQFLKNIFSEFQISHVIHLAALKDIQDSLVKQVPKANVLIALGAPKKGGATVINLSTVEVFSGISMYFLAKSPPIEWVSRFTFETAVFCFTS